MRIFQVILAVVIMLLGCETLRKRTTLVYSNIDCGTAGYDFETHDDSPIVCEEWAKGRMIRKCTRPLRGMHDWHCAEYINDVVVAECIKPYRSDPPTGPVCGAIGLKDYVKD